ncbi:MAG: lactate utilization protein C [Desulfovibrio sp.]
MTPATSARAAMLATLRAGLAAAPLAVPAPPARPASVPLGPDAWTVLAEVLAPLEVRLRLARTPAEAAAHVADIARERAAATYTRWDAALDALGLPGGFDSALAGLERLAPGCCKALAHADLGFVLAHAALLESGSLAVVAAPGQHRAASLLPPTSVALVPRRALAPDVSHLPALLDAHRLPDGSLPACLNLISGPSSTADIELVLVRGVHGPGALEVIGLDWDI